MTRCPRLSAKVIAKNIATSVANLDRAPFQEILAKTLQYTPKPKALRELASDPEKYARTIKNLAGLAGYQEQRTSLNVSMSVDDLAERLVNLYGPEKARAMLKDHGLPESLVSLPDSPVNGATIDGEAEPA